METKAPLRSSLTRTLILLTVFFIGIQIFYFVLTLYTSGVIHILIAQSVTVEFLKARVVLLPLISYLCSQVILYAIFVFCIVYISKSAEKILALRWTTTYTLGVLLWMMSVYVILEQNSKRFDQSIFTFAGINQNSFYLYQAVFWISIACLMVISLIAMLNFCLSLYKRSLNKSDIVASLLVFTALVMLIDTRNFLPQTSRPSLATAQKPNVIIVSVESLRPEFITAPYHQNVTMPFLTDELSSSIQFTESYTPIAQSFPSWISILTAKTPLHNGARSLYTHYQKIDLKHSLIHEMKAAGYETVYAVDGQRFGDITSQFGFDHIISPPYGAAELVIGSISDFPLSNLVGATPVGKYLFPYSFANRSIVATYHPDDFITLLKENLQQRSGKPLFLSIHFSLSHWPFRWANDRQNESIIMPIKYQHSLHAADQQIQQFFDLLKREDLLTHTLVIFISDHGLGLGLPGDSLSNKDLYVGDIHKIPKLPMQPYSTAFLPQKIRSGIDTSYGYSTNILSINQYHVLLAFKGYGISLSSPRKINGATSLLDVAPTILKILDLPVPPHLDGYSLAAEVKQNHRLRHEHRELFFENGFTTPEIAHADISVNTVLKSSISAVRLDTATGLLSISDTATQKLLLSKERALMYDHWLLARLPQVKSDTGFPIYVLANVKTREWTTDFNSRLALQAPLQKLLRDFNSYNQGECN